jgi:hypothetical protein
MRGTAMSDRYPDFLLPGTTCQCDSEWRCNNHDLDAEAAWWAPAPDPVAYDRDDPKRPGWLDDLLDRADD